MSILSLMLGNCPMGGVALQNWGEGGDEILFGEKRSVGRKEGRKEGSITWLDGAWTLLQRRFFRVYRPR